MNQRRIPAVFMRGGTGKGVFFHGRDLPHQPAERDPLLLRLFGSPDRFGLQRDGLGGASDDTSKVAIITPSRRDDCDVDFLYGAVGIDQPVIDWTGNCTNLTAAVGPFAVQEGLVAPVDGVTRVRIWQANLGCRIDAFVPVRDAEVLEAGAFTEDGVPFTSAEIRLEFLAPSAQSRGELPLLPSGAVKDSLQVPKLGEITATMVCAGDPTVFVRAASIGMSGREAAADIERDRKLLDKLEAIRAAAAVRMGLAATPEEVARMKISSPKIAWVGRPAVYRTEAGEEVTADRIDVLARLVSGGRLHHGLTGATAISLAAAAALPGSVVNEVARTLPGLPTRIGHQSGVLAVGAELSRHEDGSWHVDRAIISRSARRLMSGWVYLPPAGISGRA